VIHMNQGFAGERVGAQHHLCRVTRILQKPLPNPRIAVVGRDLWGSSSPTPCLIFKAELGEEAAEVQQMCPSRAVCSL